jgi:hypothetical protein
MKALDDVKVTQAIMWLCAQPSVAKHIRKLWRNPVQQLAHAAARRKERK